MRSSTSRPAWHDPWRNAALIAGLLAGPVMWLALLETNYVLSYVSCESRHTWFIHAAILAAVLIVGWAGWQAWRHGPAENNEDRGHPVTRTTGESRARWMSFAGIAMSVWFILVILSMEIPVLVLKTCQ